MEEVTGQFSTLKNEDICDM